MVKRLKRLDEFTIEVEVEDENFIRPPSDAQRNTLLNRAVDEFCEHLYALDDAAERFVSGSPDTSLEDRTDKILSDDEIMEEWQLPIMKAMAGITSKTQGDVLEIGFGLGIASSLIQERGVRSHTIIECNSSVIERFDNWKSAYPGSSINIVEGKWQDTIDQLGEYDAIFFHTYPLNEHEYMEYVAKSSTFAEHFFGTASTHLRVGGVFTYFSNEIDSLSRAHQRALLKEFSSFSVSVVGLNIEEGVRDSWWADSMAIVEAKK